MNTVAINTGYVRIAAAILLSFAASAYAADKPCAGDATKLCLDVQPGKGRIAACLREHRDELSPACKQNIEKARAKVKKAANDCRDDMEKYCKDVEPGQGRIAQCLKQHETELAPACKAHLAKPQGQRN